MNFSNINTVWWKFTALLLIAGAGIASNWWVFFLVIVPAFLIVSRGWKPDNDKTDEVFA